MLTIIILTMLFGGGSIEIFSSGDFRAVENAVEEQARAEAATQSMERVNAELEALVQKRIEYFEALSVINERVDASAAEYDEIIDGLWDVRRSAVDTYLDEVFVLRETMTREEWYDVFNDR